MSCMRHIFRNVKYFWLWLNSSNRSCTVKFIDEKHSMVFFYSYVFITKYIYFKTFSFYYILFIFFFFYFLFQIVNFIAVHLIFLQLLIFKHFIDHLSYRQRLYFGSLLNLNNFFYMPAH